MALSDKELIRRANVRYNKLLKEDIQNDVRQNLEQELRIFYSKNKQYTKNPLYISKRMDSQQRKVMRSILRSFLSDEQSTTGGINRKYKSYLKSVNNHRQKPLRQKTIKEQAKELKVLERILTNRMMNNILSSDQKQSIWEEQRNSNISRKDIRNGFMKLVEEQASETDIVFNKEMFLTGNMEFSPLENLSGDEVIDKIIQYALEEGAII